MARLAIQVLAMGWAFQAIEVATAAWGSLIVVSRAASLPLPCTTPQGSPERLHCNNTHLTEPFPSIIFYPQDPSAALAKLTEALQRFYPSMVPKSLIWGYGRPLWDPSSRVYGRKPLRVVVLGPAGSGKSTQCELLSHRCVPGRDRSRASLHGVTCA